MTTIDQGSFLQRERPVFSLEADADMEISDLRTSWIKYMEIGKKESVSTPIHVGTGPVYHARTSGGIDIDVHTIFIALEKLIHAYALIAHSSDQVIGYRNSYISDTWKSRGYIYTALRNKGVSSVIDSAHADLLQRTANQLQHSITWEILNKNKTVLDRLAADFQTTPEPSMVAGLSNKHQEQARWQRQYGKGGKFGINKSGQVDITRQISWRTGKVIPEDIETIQDIYLTKNETGLFVPVEIERISTDVEKEALRAKSLGEMQKLLSIDSEVVFA